MNIAHFVLTHFNLLETGMSIYDNPELSDPDIWMEKRKDLFDKIVFPMMLRQTNKNFTWLISFSKKTPEHYYADYVSNTELNIRIVYEPLIPFVHKLIKTDPVDWIITSRIDNDDFYLSTAVDHIQNALGYACFNNEPSTLFDFNYLVWDIRTDTFYEQRRQLPNSTFLSVAEHQSEQPLKMVHHVDHTYMFNHFKVYRTPMYLGVVMIHSDNRIERVLGPPPNPELIKTIKKGLSQAGYQWKKDNLKINGEESWPRFSV